MASKAGRIAVVGAGAIAEMEHLPTLSSLGRQASILVDPSLDRIRALAKRFKIPAVESDHNALGGKVEAAIVAAPHRFHADIAIDLLNQGIHILVEKPMAITGRDCDRMIDAARASGRLLTVGLMRRQLTSHQWLKAALDGQILGEITGFRFLEGGLFGWPLKSADLWSPTKSGGGVLLDTGAHTLDQLIWWLGEPDLVSYRDDNLGGVEAECEIALRLKNGGTGLVALSRTRVLPGIAIIEGTRGRIQVELFKNRIVADPDNLLDAEFGGSTGRQQRPESFRDLYRRQLEAFLNAVDSGGPAPVDGVEAAKSVRLMEACYLARQPLDLPWLASEIGQPANAELSVAAGSKQQSCA
jgi:predicted dehydrogenase